jgi:tetratricopeptide (TPR) repeat protein
MNTGIVGALDAINGRKPMTGKHLSLLLTACLLSLASLVYATQASLTPAEQKIAAARKAIATNASNAEAHARLAMALSRRARETADPDYYEQALAVAERSLALAPGNLDAERARIWVLLGKHEFTRALDLAKAFNQRVPDDVAGYGFLVDANAELGNYEAAQQAAQWMLDLRPGNVPGLTRAAYLRELFGDADGALELMQMALQRTPPDEAEDRAWVLTQMAHLQLAAARVDSADRLVEQALAVFAEYHYALGVLGRVRAAQGRHDEAVAAFERRYRLAPHPENLFVLGEALKRAGKRAEATKAFAEFEQAARAEMRGADNSNRELIYYYADHANRPAEALRVAETEFGRRRDVRTLDAYAWALYRNGRYARAREQMEAALRVGVREPAMLYHAGAIALKRGDRQTAIARLKESLALGPGSDTTEAARRMLQQAQRGTPTRLVAR